MLVKRIYAFTVIYAASIFLLQNQPSKLKSKKRLNDEAERYLVFENKTMMNFTKPLTKNKIEILQETDFQKSPRRYLLFTSAGDKSNVKQWLGHDRNYDIVVVYYGNMTFQLDVDELYIRKDTKFPNLKWYMHTHSIDKYSAIAVWDDDIVASVDSINSLFVQMLNTDADIFSPCHTTGSYHQLLRFNREGVRDINFIEMNAPMFLPWKLNDFIVQFDPIIKGWGTDIWYSYRCNHILDGCIMKVSDTTCVTNPKTRKDGTREISKVQSDKTREKIWKTFARDILNQSSDVPVYDHNHGNVKPIRNNTSTIGWNQFCKQNLKNNLTFAKYADKVGVKKIVREYNLNIRIPKTYATVTNASDITLKMIKSLPKKYIFKANHGAYMTVIVKNNSFTCHGYCGKLKYYGNSKILQLEFLMINCRKWLSIDFGKIHDERHYSEIHRQCFFEEMISQNNDYKIHTFHEKPAMIEVYTNRFKGHFKAFYTPTWRKIGMNKTIPEPTTDVKKPVVLIEMLEVAKQLSRGLLYVRVDLYVNKHTVVFSELTMSPSACRTTYTPPIVDEFYGLLATGGNQDPESIISLLK